MAIGVVGYTTRFRTFTLTQLETTYKKIAELGYNGVENCIGKLAGIPWEEDWKLIQKYNLKVADANGDMDKSDELKRKADTMRVNNIWLPPVPNDMMNSVDGFKAYAERINNWVKNYRGYKLIYHHHAKEFVNFPSLDGKTGMHILIENTDLNAVGFIIDTFWASCAGADPAQWILKVQNRIPVIHFKDFAIDWKNLQNDQFHIQRFAEIGQGNINWPAVVDACRQAGVEWYCVEQDQTTMDEFESLKMSITFMKNLGIK